MMRIAARIIASLLLVCAAGCEKEAVSYAPSFSSEHVDGQKTYNFGILPVHNPKLLLERYGPVLEYLNARVKNARFRLEASRNYEDFEQKLCAGKFAFALANPYEVALALKRDYRVFGKMGDDHYFRGIFLVRRDSSIRELKDLKGKKISYPAKTSMAASMLPQYFLQTHGIDVHKDVENLYVGSQESSIMNVYMGNVAAGVVSARPWLSFQRDHPAQAAQLKVQWETEPLVHNGLLAHKDVAPELSREIGTLMAGMHETAEGRAVLDRLMISRFDLASDATYDVALAFLKRYSETVSPLVW